MQHMGEKISRVLGSWAVRWKAGSSGVMARVRGVEKIYGEISRETGSFQKKAGLSCPGRCGHCCANSNVEATILEMLPLADALLHRGEVDRWWHKAEAQSFSGRCIFYAPDQGNENDGRCEVYALRPLICRLFGYSGNRDKYGKLRLVACGVMKKGAPIATEKALQEVFSGRLAPVAMADAVMRVAALDPELARESLPINLAFKKSIERMGLYRKFKQ
ncbi:MAG: YkgJ family cysteine cluster protein [Candidatus Omnitrophica bacterium]|nr:YkgJ family cysteine cluster protein [Candidatus Omnitrophota bacterium]